MNKVVEVCVGSVGNNELKREYKEIQTNIEQNLQMLNDRNDLTIEHRRATTNLTGRMNDLLRQDIELLQSNEQ